MRREHPIERFSTPNTGFLWGKLRDLAREKRQVPTHAEDALWQHLRCRETTGFKFRRQHAIDRFIVDFFCADAALVIEVDGSSHDDTAEVDAERQAYLESIGLRVLRFSNGEVYDDLDRVLEDVRQALRHVEGPG